MTHKHNIAIDEEFQNLLPPLPPEVFEELERSLLTEGCRDAVVLWNGVIVDGHNRYTICQEHDLPFQTTDKDFSSRQDAKRWIISTQIGRRQLSHEETAYYRGLQHNLEKSVKGTNNQYVKRREKSHGETSHAASTDTAQRIADQHNVSRASVLRASNYATAVDRIGSASPDAKKLILKGDSNITHRELERLHNASDTEISAVAEQIATGTYVKQVALEKPLPVQAESDLTHDFISAGINTLDHAVRDAEKGFHDLYERMETQEARDLFKRTFATHIERLVEIITRI